MCDYRLRFSSTGVYNAIVNSCLNSIGYQYRYGIDLQTHSWRISPANMLYFSQQNFNLITNAVHFANRMNVTVVCGQGNESSYVKQYPASLDDDWSLSVGGTGPDGQYWEYGNKSITLDISAPASESNVFNLSKVSENSYAPFNGTSAATPHVAGTVALMMSYYNGFNYLAPEDCEQIIQMSATDIGGVGHDDSTGYGRLNAGKALAQIDTNIFSIRHIKSDLYPTIETIVQITPSTSFDTIILSEPYKNEESIWFQPKKYLVKKQKITHQIFHNIPLDTFVKAFWARPSSSSLLDDFDVNNNNLLIPHQKVKIESLDNEKAILSAYSYTVYDTLNQFLGFWPRSQSWNYAKMSYSMLLSNSKTASITVFEKDNSVQIFPNPTSKSQQIKVKSDKNSNLRITLFDLMGKEVMTVYDDKTIDSITEINIDLSNLNSGFYVYKINLDNQTNFIKSQKL